MLGLTGGHLSYSCLADKLFALSKWAAVLRNLPKYQNMYAKKKSVNSVIFEDKLENLTCTRQGTCKDSLILNLSLHVIVDSSDNNIYSLDDSIPSHSLRNTYCQPPKLFAILACRLTICNYTLRNVGHVMNVSNALLIKIEERCFLLVFYTYTTLYNINSAVL